MRLRRRCWILLGLLLLALPALATCATHIEPPDRPADPATVYITDYGRHAGLLLPASDGTLVEWTYGEWRWFALDESAWYRIFPAMLWPTRGTLGRRHLEPVDGDADLAAARLTERLTCEYVHAVRVDAGRVDDLATQLEARYQIEIATQHYQEIFHLDFVQDAENYHLFHNCNHEVASWLAELGCEVSGPAVLSDWEVGAPQEQ